ncbi:uncharacterized protein [Physcomitrium patens]|uniref:Uncharacterized protein n=1 Tax=Physcomitrium patens TaxID=3218 RepID=A0A2K1J9Q4_PHYPA|nr:uncharacterized protein LOC112293807 [Physcomitrium patens]PNR38256.1 hypothetical protein PHYPA_021367 [Physcomitrium patens]|eukprot:XP_024399440.1 uncharacterized protein LOC112293807 [Physcomitrella patens]
MGAIPAMATAKLLNPRLTSSSHSPFSLSPSKCFPQCFPISSSSGTFQSKGGARLMRFASNVVTVMGGSVVENPHKLCASQHVGSGSVERNDAAPTGPLVKPEAKLTAKEAVEAQMNTLVENDDPRPDHGLEVMYQFANTEGMNGSTMTHYFGFASDLYHFGHFALKFKSRYPELICHAGYEIISVLEDEDRCEVKLKLLQGRDKADAQFVFSLSKRSRGVLPPCWLTDSLLKLSEEV